MHVPAFSTGVLGRQLSKRQLLISLLERKKKKWLVIGLAHKTFYS